MRHRNFASSRDNLNLARSLDWRIDCIFLTDKNGWPVVKAGQRDESALRALAASTLRPLWIEGCIGSIRPIVEGKCV